MDLFSWHVREITKKKPEKKPSSMVPFKGNPTRAKYIFLFPHLENRFSKKKLQLREYLKTLRKLNFFLHFWQGFSEISLLYAGSSKNKKKNFQKLSEFRSSNKFPVSMRVRRFSHFNALLVFFLNFWKTIKFRNIPEKKFPAKKVEKNWISIFAVLRFFSKKKTVLTMFNFSMLNPLIVSSKWVSRFLPGVTSEISDFVSPFLLKIILMIS